jgi:hypothetical protein
MAPARATLGAPVVTPARHAALRASLRAVLHPPLPATGTRTRRPAQFRRPRGDSLLDQGPGPDFVRRSAGSSCLALSPAAAHDQRDHGWAGSLFGRQTQQRAGVRLLLETLGLGWLPSGRHLCRAVRAGVHSLCSPLRALPLRACHPPVAFEQPVAPEIPRPRLPARAATVRAAFPQGAAHQSSPLGLAPGRAASTRPLARGRVCPGRDAAGYAAPGHRAGLRLQCFRCLRPFGADRRRVAMPTRQLSRPHRLRSARTGGPTALRRAASATRGPTDEGDSRHLPAQSEYAAHPLSNGRLRRGPGPSGALRMWSRISHPGGHLGQRIGRGGDPGRRPGSCWGKSSRKRWTHS